MSRRRSTGDLVPRDITEILAREAKVQRGQRKAGSSLGQAFSWLKGSRKKKSVGNGLNRTGTGGTEAKVGLGGTETTKAGPKGTEDQKRLTVHYTASQHYQENVFIEGSRPQYLEDLHTEAQEGLKILQQEEHKNGVNFVDNESVASTDTLHVEREVGSKDEGASPDSRRTTGTTDTSVSSAVSTRPVLTRQGSTFKPLNPVKRLDKCKKRSRRTTIMGIPNHVQRELALHRSSTFQQVVSTQLPKDTKSFTEGQSGVVVIPTVDGGTPVVNREGARVHLSELEASEDERLRKHIQSVYQDEQTFNHQSFSCPPGPLSVLRPKSLAVPGVTTSTSFSPSMLSFLQEPQGPVMSISPQATYLSTIIPNAVLPASIEVIEIDRSNSRTRSSNFNHGGSVRTVSKSSLASLDSSVSPLMSRKSDGEGSQADTFQESFTTMPTSASGSNWSESQSSKTIISNSSPITSKVSTISFTSQKVDLNGQEIQVESGGDQDGSSLYSSVSAFTSSRGKSEKTLMDEGSESGQSSSAAGGDDPKNKNCLRSLSVTKIKQPPAPPRRTNSLHNNKLKGASRVCVHIKDLNGSSSPEAVTVVGSTVAKDDHQPGMAAADKTATPVLSSPGSNSSFASYNSSGEAGKATESLPGLKSSSQHKPPSEDGKFDRTMSPSSGYSSQSGTPTLSQKGISPTSPDKEKRKPVKPERAMSRASSEAASPSSSLTSLSSATSEPVNPDVPTCCPGPPVQRSPPTASAKEISPSLRAEVRELLNIPPPPKVRAPCPPPPETWVHNRRTFELLCGPCPGVSATQKPTRIPDATTKQAGPRADVGEDFQGFSGREISDKTASEVSEGNAQTSAAACTEGVQQDLLPDQRAETKQEALLIQDGSKASTEVQHQDTGSSHVSKDLESEETTTKEEPPPVLKKPLVVLHREESASTEQPVGMQNNQTTEVENTKTLSEDGVILPAEKTERNKDAGGVLSTKTLSVDSTNVKKTSPPPSPPPAYQPTPPPSRKTPPSSVSVAPEELQKVQEEMHIGESCWPPPPPPLEGDAVFDGDDDVDFPPPPPPLPLIGDSASDVMGSCTSESAVTPSLTEEEVVEVVQSEGIICSQPSPDLLPSATQTVVYNDKPEMVLGVSEPAEIPCRPAQIISESVPPPSIIKTENPTSASVLTSPNTFLKPESLPFEDESLPEPPVSAQVPVTVPAAPPLPAEGVSCGVNFRRQPSVATRDNRSKELLARHKSAPIPKEDANIPLVTPSLLQMVRLRSVNMSEDQAKTLSEATSTSQGTPVQESCPASNQGPQNIPQKPIRKSLSLKSPPQTVKTSLTPNTPSMRLQEAIRMKTAAMSSGQGLPCRLGARTASYSCPSEPGLLALKSPEGLDMHKSPASTASFIFSRSTKKVVIETAAASSPEVQASLKQSLAAELMQFSDHSNVAAAYANGGVKSDRVPPPVARKPTHGGISPHHPPASSAKTEFSRDGNSTVGAAQHMREISPTETTTTRVTADTIETLF